ncbi:MAG TPA: hypothetical protein VNJ08_04040 [Bacteriovoracaceae bacterium]|nr:hypothetical protein [Bacteriovoracaceae bacterium]
MRKIIIMMIAAAIMPVTGMSSPTNPAKWQRIYPVKDCMNFHLVYYKDGSKYYLTYPVPAGGKNGYRDPYITVNSINDLSGIADVIADEANKLCNQPKDISVTDASCNSLENLDPEFIKLVQDAANAVGKSGKNKCKELTQYLELHDKIVGLDSKNPVQISGASNVGNAILKIFANTTDSQLIDHFEECGGKANSHKFIENLLLVECNKACIMPKPPGILSWDEMRAIAGRIALKHRNKSILSIRDDKPEIEKDALLEITRVASLNQIKELMPKLDAEKSLNALDSYGNLQKARSLKESSKDKSLSPDHPKDLKTYISLVYTPDAAIEIAEKSIEGVVNENMMDKMPKDWTPERKKQYIKDALLPKAMLGFNECMDAPRKRINYGHKADAIVNLNYRVWMKEEYCKKNKTICLQAKKTSCSTENKASINLLSMDPNITDADVAKSCVMNGLARIIQPVFALTLTTQVDSFKNDITLPADLAERFSENSWTQFKSCINTHTVTRKSFKEGKIFQPIYRDGGTNDEAFRKMSPEDFKKLFSDCSDQVEQKLTLDFVEVVFISNENVTKNNPFGPMIDFHGTKYPAGAVMYTQNTVKKNIEKCYEQQRLNNKEKPLFKPSPTLCSPLMEIEVAKGIIELKLNKMFKDKNLTKNAEARKVLEDFAACSNNAYQETLKNVSNPQSDPALRTSEDVKPYMEKNKTFYNCVEAALVGTSRIVAGNEYKNAIVKKKKTLKNFDSILKMEKEVKEVVGKCFQEEMMNVGSWPKFKDFNAEDGMKAVEVKCAKAANKYAIPRIMVKETFSQVQQVKKDGLIDTDNDVAAVIGQAANDIKGALGLQVNSQLKGNEYLLEVFGEGLDAYQSKYPKATQDDYLNFFKKKVTIRVVEKVHVKLLSKIKSSAKARYGMDLSELDKSLTSSCVLDLYNNLSTDKNQQQKKASSDPLDLDELTDQVVDGFNYLKQSPAPAFQDQMTRIAAFCKDAKNYTNVEDIKKTGLLDFLVKAQIHKKTVEAFKKMASDTYDDELIKYHKTDYYHRAKPFIEKKRSDMLALIKDKLEDRGNFEKMMFPGSSSPITSFAIENSEDATKEGSSANKQLNAMVMAQMFKDRSRHGFASKFSEAQIVNSVGMEGYKEAELGIYASLNKRPNIAITVHKYATQALKKNWTVNKVHERVDWHGLPDFARDSMVDAVYTHAITPVVNGESELTVRNEKSKLGKVISSHLEAWHKDGKTFKEVFAEEIEKDTKASIPTMEAADEWIGRVLSW